MAAWAFFETRFTNHPAVLTLCTISSASRSFRCVYLRVPQLVMRRMLKWMTAGCTAFLMGKLRVAASLALCHKLPHRKAASGTSGCFRRNISPTLWTFYQLSCHGFSRILCECSVIRPWWDFPLLPGTGVLRSVCKCPS